MVPVVAVTAVVHKSLKLISCVKIGMYTLIKIIIYVIILSY